MLDWYDPWMFALTILAVCGAAHDGGFDDIARPFLDRYCVRCHGAEVTEEDLDLVRADGAALTADPEGWDWLLERVEFGDMPPVGEVAPSAEDREAFVAWLRHELSDDAAEVLPLVGVSLRRLTRPEYESAARSILGVSIDASRFLPEDAVGYGFDHVAAAQTLSEADFVRYLEAAEAVAERALPRDEPGPPRVRRYSPSDMVGGHARGDARWLSRVGTAGPLAALPRAGEYIVRAEAYGQQAGPDPCRVRLVLGDGAQSETFEVAAGRSDAGVVLEARLTVERAGDHLAAVRFLNDYYVPRRAEQPGEDRNLAVRWVEVIGPVDELRPTEFAVALAARAMAAEDRASTVSATVRELAQQIWRTPRIEEDDLDRLLSLAGPSEDVGARVRAALVGLLASPRFLFKFETGVEHDDGRDVQPDVRGSVALQPGEVATRLAGFLWNAVPDAALLERVEHGALREPGGVRALAATMLADPRAEALAWNFGEQWLQLRGTELKRADRRAYPGFSNSLRASMLGETRRVLVDSLRARRDLWDLVNGAETIIDDRLARLYGIDDGGQGWRRVSLAETERRGLVGHASVLFATSESTRTSPVRRGKWVLEVLLGSAPPPPPPEAGNLPEPIAGAAELSVRERFEAHRSNPTCAACHARMDPLGFGLEAYDGIGALRALDDPARGDVSGTLPDGRMFDGPAELTAILRDEDQFLVAFVERLFVYALGRGIERADRGTIATVVDALRSGTPTFERAILEIVACDEFLRLPRPRVNSESSR